MADLIWTKRVRFLTHALVLSIALNVGLLTSLILFAINEKNAKEPWEEQISSQEVELSSTPLIQVLWDFFNLSFDQLALQLKESQHIENGYKKRDLALACLVSFHHLDLEKAIAGFPMQKRSLFLSHKEGGEKLEVFLFPGLEDEHFQKISLFLEKEKWPFTQEGLFFELKRQYPKISSSLKKTVYTTSFFQIPFTLLNRDGMHIAEEPLLDMLCHGNWDYLKEFIKDPSNVLIFSKEKKWQFLKKFALSKSKDALSLLLDLDAERIGKEFDDQELKTVFSLFQKEDARAHTFLKNLSEGLRSDSMRYLASKMLYEWNGKTLTKEAYQKSEGEKQRIMPVNHIQPPKKKMHRIRPGDSLWKIAKEYHVELKKLREKNSLRDTDVLHVGKEIEIP